MTRSWRPLALAAVLNVTAGVGTAAAQTVFVRNAAPGAPIEVVVNGTKAGSGAADVGGSTPKLLLIKGRYTPPKPAAEGEETHTWRPSPTGMVVYGAAGLASVRDAVAIACGNVTNCSGKSTRPSYAAGATYWITRYL